MDGWAAAAAWVAAIVALASTGATLYLQWWRRPEVRWLCDGYSYTKRGQGTYGPVGEVDRIIAVLQLVNCGDGHAYGVETLRSNGDRFETFAVFEAGVVPPGGSVKVRMSIATDHWDTCWVEPRYRQHPTSRSTELRPGPRFHPSRELADRNRLPPGYDPTSRGVGSRAPDLGSEAPRD